MQNKNSRRLASACGSHDSKVNRYSLRKRTSTSATRKNLIPAPLLGEEAVGVVGEVELDDRPARGTRYELVGRLGELAADRLRALAPANPVGDVGSAVSAVPGALTACLMNASGPAATRRSPLASCQSPTWLTAYTACAFVY